MALICLELPVTTLATGEVEHALISDLWLPAAPLGAIVDMETHQILQEGSAHSPMGQRLLHRFANATSADFGPPQRSPPRPLALDE